VRFDETPPPHGLFLSCESMKKLRRRDVAFGSVALATLAMLPCASGCLGALVAPVDPATLGIGNPLFVSGGDREFIYNQVVDSLDDYFKIRSERRLKLVGGIVTPGRIDTFPVIGTTLLEPWRKDFALDRETTHNTLQTIRRFAVVEILPSDGGYLISVNVMKELEDLKQPQVSTLGRSATRFDNSLDRTAQTIEQEPNTLGWIPLGRDITFEQQILLDLQGRLHNAP
jgi:hypothetical protein